MLRSSCPAPKPQIGPTRPATSSPNSFSHQMLLALVAGRQHDQVGRQQVAAAQPCALGDEPGDVGELHQADRAVDDQVGAADIEVVPAAAGQVLELPARAVRAEIEPEADPLQAVEQVLVELPRLLREADVALPRERKRHRGRDQVAVLERGFVVQRVGQLRARLEVDDQGRAALHERDPSAARVQVLGDVVAAVAGTYHEDVPAPPGFAVVVLAGVEDRAGEVAQTRDVRQVRDAADAGRHDDVARAHLPRAAFAAQQDGPALLLLVVRAALERGGGPVVELQRLDIGLEPAGELVLGNVGRPARRKRHVGQVVDVHLVVQGERMVAPAPVVADARPAVDD
jgi:hypothetical protein